MGSIGYTYTSLIFTYVTYNRVGLLFLLYTSLQMTHRLKKNQSGNEVRRYSTKLNGGTPSYYKILKSLIVIK